MIVINFKNYKFGADSLRLAKIIERVLPNVVVAVSAVDLKEISKKTKLKVFAQHVDFVEGERATGFVLPEGVKKVGGVGSLLNHSEHRLSFGDLKRSIDRCKKVELKTIVCASSLREVKRVLKLNPYAIAFEDSKLVGSGKSITKYKAGDVSRFVNILRGSNSVALCGAGISSFGDVKEAYRLGCGGVLIASAIAKGSVKKSEKLLREIKRL